MAKRKHKLTIRPRNEAEVMSHKVADWIARDGHDPWETVPLDGDYMQRTIADAMEGADWSDDPGTGHSVQLVDGRELLNPIPVAPPASIAANSEPSVNDLVERALARHFEQLKANDEIDTIEDADDFGEDDDWTPFSQFEVVLRDEAPAIPKEPSPPEAVEEVKKVEAELPPPVT